MKLGRVSEALVSDLAPCFCNGLLIPLDQLQECLDRLPKLRIGRRFLKLCQHDAYRDNQLWESHHVTVRSQVESKALKSLFDNAVLDLLGFEMLFGDLQ